MFINCRQTYSLSRLHLDIGKEVLALSWQDGSADVCGSSLTTWVQPLEPTVGRQDSTCKPGAHRAGSHKQMESNWWGRQWIVLPTPHWLRGRDQNSDLSASPGASGSLSDVLGIMLPTVGHWLLTFAAGSLNHTTWWEFPIKLPFALHCQTISQMLLSLIFQLMKLPFLLLI